MPFFSWRTPLATPTRFGWVVQPPYKECRPYIASRTLLRLISKVQCWMYRSSIRIGVLTPVLYSFNLYMVAIPCALNLCEHFNKLVIKFGIMAWYREVFFTVQIWIDFRTSQVTVSISLLCRLLGTLQWTALVLCSLSGFGLYFDLCSSLSHLDSSLWRACTVAVRAPGERQLPKISQESPDSATDLLRKRNP